jgi:hypothetical protein
MEALRSRHCSTPARARRIIANGSAKNEAPSHRLGVIKADGPTAAANARNHPMRLKTDDLMCHHDPFAHGQKIDGAQRRAIIADFVHYALFSV